MKASSPQWLMKNLHNFVWLPDPVFQPAAEAVTLLPPWRWMRLGCASWPTTQSSRCSRLRTLWPAASTLKVLLWERSKDESCCVLLVVAVVAFPSWTLWYMQFYTDKCISQGERIACVTRFYEPSSVAATCRLQIIYLHFWKVDASSHMPSSKDWSPFLEGGCCYSKSSSGLKIVST